MQIRTDDEIYAVDARWLGPEGKTLPWRARYTAYGVWSVLFVLALIVRQQIAAVGFMSYLICAVLAAAATRALMALVTPDRKVRNLVVVFFRELSAPRRRTKGMRGRVDPARVRVRPP